MNWQSFRHFVRMKTVEGGLKVTPKRTSIKTLPGATGAFARSRLRHASAFDGQVSGNMF